jgi:hypothetical protein
MTRAQSRQVTPSTARVWIYGILATAVATALNIGWLRLATNGFGWTVQVPVLFNTSDLVEASDWRVSTATVTVGVAATAGASLLARSVIAPRVWWALISLFIGGASIYELMVVAGLDVTVRIRLAVFHVLTMTVLIPVMYRSLHVTDEDLRKALSRFQEHIEQDKLQVTKPFEASGASTISRVDEPTPVDVVVPVLNPDSLIGMPEDAALTTAAAAGCEMRVTSRDSTMYTTTRDFRADRVNVDIVNGRVTSASMG